jgi:hypothetical protein
VIEFVSLTVEIGEKELARASELERLGFGGFDAVHLILLVQRLAKLPFFSLQMTGY